MVKSRRGRGRPAKRPPKPPGDGQTPPGRTSTPPAKQLKGDVDDNESNKLKAGHDAQSEGRLQGLPAGSESGAIADDHETELKVVPEGPSRELPSELAVGADDGSTELTALSTKGLSRPDLPSEDLRGVATYIKSITAQLRLAEDVIRKLVAQLAGASDVVAARAAEGRLRDAARKDVKLTMGQMTQAEGRICKLVAQLARASKSMAAVLKGLLDAAEKGVINADDQRGEVPQVQSESKIIHLSKDKGKGLHTPFVQQLPISVVDDNKELFNLKSKTLHIKNLKEVPSYKGESSKPVPEAAALGLPNVDSEKIVQSDDDPQRDEVPQVQSSERIHSSKSSPGAEEGLREQQPMIPVKDCNEELREKLSPFHIIKRRLYTSESSKRVPETVLGSLSNVEAEKVMIDHHRIGEVEPQVQSDRKVSSPNEGKQILTRVAEEGSISEQPILIEDSDSEVQEIPNYVTPKSTSKRTRRYRPY
ncbi:unnamed protein product [Calypogeia fissa]